MIDTKMNMNAQAYALMHFLSTVEPHTARYHDGEYQIDIRCVPYMNCRERGFVLEMRRNLAEPITCLAFFEHRNSDALCCIRWQPKWSKDCYEASDIPESIYPDKYAVTCSWNYMDLNSAADYVLDVIGELSPDNEVTA